MGTGGGQILALPWEEYLSFPFNNERTVGNPMSDLFRRPVISGDDINLPSVYSNSTVLRSEFLEYAFALGPRVRDFGASLARLDIKYVVLAKVTYWNSYETWLSRQSDLTLVFRSPDLVVWRNDSPGVVYGTRTTNGVLSVGLAHLLTNGPSPALSGPQDAVKVSPTEYEVKPGPARWIELSERYDPGWTPNGKPGRLLPEGNIGWPIGHGGATIVFNPWLRVRIGYAESAVAFLATLLAAVVVRRRRGGVTVPATGDPVVVVTAPEEAMCDA
jgi:hypothetical protein